MFEIIPVSWIQFNKVNFNTVQANVNEGSEVWSSGEVINNYLTAITFGYQHLIHEKWHFTYQSTFSGTQVLNKSYIADDFQQSRRAWLSHQNKFINFSFGSHKAWGKLIYGKFLAGLSLDFTRYFIKITGNIIDYSVMTDSNVLTYLAHYDIIGLKMPLSIKWDTHYLSFKVTGSLGLPVIQRKSYEHIIANNATSLVSREETQTSINNIIDLKGRGIYLSFGFGVQL